jgi:hypothetical protein
MRGRPHGRRCWLPSNVCAIRRVYQRRRVSLGGRDCRDLWQASTAKGRGERCQAMTVRVREAEPAATTLGFQDAVFREERGDDLWLVTWEPASDHGDHDVEDHRHSSGWSQ